MTTAEKNAKISAMILTRVAAGESLAASMNAVLGAGTFEKVTGEIYDSLREEPRIYVVGSYWAQISERAAPTMLTKAEAQSICDKWNADDVEVKAGNSPFFVTTNTSKAAH